MFIVYCKKIVLEEVNNRKKIDDITSMVSKNLKYVDNTTEILDTSYKHRFTVLGFHVFR